MYMYLHFPSGAHVCGCLGSCCGISGWWILYWAYHMCPRLLSPACPHYQRRQESQGGDRTVEKVAAATQCLCSQSGQPLLFLPCPKLFTNYWNCRCNKSWIIHVHTVHVDILFSLAWIWDYEVIQWRMVDTTYPCQNLWYKCIHSWCKLSIEGNAVVLAICQPLNYTYM